MLLVYRDGSLEVPASCLAFSNTIAVRVLGALLQPLKGGRLSSPLRLCCMNGDGVTLFCVWCLAQVERLLAKRVLVLLSCFLLCSVTRGSRILLGLFLSVSIGISISASNLGYIRQKGHTRTHHQVKVPS